MATKEFTRCLEIANNIGIVPEDREFNYGKGIGRADNYCQKNDWLIVFEIELNQRHPEMNVMKAWRFLEENTDKKMILVHFITNTSKVSPNRIELCQWVGNRMEKYLPDRFKYQLFKNNLNKDKLTQLKLAISKL